MKAALTNRAGPCYLLAQMTGCVIVLRSISDHSTPKHCVERVKVHDDQEDERWR
jgi:hypothetical protein